MTLTLDTYLFSLLISAVVINIGLSLYGVFRKPSLIKKIIALTIFGDTANVLAIIVGYRSWPGPWSPPVPPILLNTHPTHADITKFAATAVDPLPQALVLTAVVIG
ncbi:MAG: NADH-quinone oxidoreductase subunit K, partial [Desulfurococcales archaeon]|nr:NADH-quinone oxidoreductase subunit K [Desulfurococcales archaeon]